MRFAIFTDVHCGPNMDTRWGENAPKMLEKAVEILKTLDVQFVVDLGDRINDVDLEYDRKSVAAIRDAYAKLGRPVYFIYGNHDTVNLSKDEYGKMVGKSGPYESVEVGDYRLLLLDSVDPVYDRVGGTYSKAQVQWIKEAIASSDKEILIFSHHPIAEYDIESHWYFGKNPHHAFVQNRADVLPLVNEKVRAMFSGHLHWIRKVTTGKTVHFTVPSFVDVFLTGSMPPGFFTVVDISSDSLKVQFRTLEGVYMTVQ